MPFRRRAPRKMTTRRKRRAPTKRKKAGPKVTAILKNKTVAALRYVENITIDPGAASITNHVMRANSVFDPDQSGVGHQPLMYDEYSLLYEQYRVLSAKIKVTPIPDTVGNHIPCTYGVFRDPDTTLSYVSGNAIIEDKRNKGGWGFTGFNSFVGKLNSISRSTTFNAKRDMSPAAAGNSIPIASNPSTQEFDYYFQIWAASINGNDPGHVNFLVQIDYVVEFSDPKHLVQS